MGRSSQSPKKKKNHAGGVHSCFLIPGSDECNGLSEEERGNSRPQMWSKYPVGVQKEFGYDSTHDLDSDWRSCDNHQVLSQALEGFDCSISHPGNRFPGITHGRRKHVQQHHHTSENVCWRSISFPLVVGCFASFKWPCSLGDKKTKHKQKT